MKIPTKVPLLDDMLSGGIVRGSSTLLWCAPFVNGSVLTYQICNNWLEQKGTIIYMVNNKRPDIVIEDAMKYGWEFKSHINKGNFAFIDAYTGIMGIQSNEKYVVSDPLNVNEVKETVISAIREAKGRNTLITIDSLSTMIDHFGDEVLSCISDWNKIAFLNDVSMFYIFSEWNYERELKDKIADLCDNIINMSVIERNIIVGDVFSVKKADGKPVKRKLIPFKYVKPGGLRVYVPKILITGPYNAGKTTIVHALSTRAISVDRKGTTVALDFGHLEYKGFTADLFGTIGQERFDPVLEQLGGESLGVILVVDSTKPETFPRALEMLKKARVYGLPLVVFANKQDLPGALTPEEVRNLMHLPSEIPVVGTVATEKKNIYEGLEKLLELIFKGDWK